MLVLLDIGNNTAAFGNEGVAEEQQGLMHWTQPMHKSGNLYTVTVSGRDTQGQNFVPQNPTIEVDGDLNPTKVFWAIYKVLDKLVCPNCDRGY